MKKHLCLLVLAVVGTLYAEPDYLKYHQAFGIKASNLSGYGAFYGYKPAKKWRLQITGIPYLLDSEFQNKRHRIFNYTIGLETQKDIIQGDQHRFYLMAGGYYYHDDDETIDINPFHAIKDSYNAGFGVGYEYFFHRVSLGLELGYKIYRDKSVEKEGSGDWVPVIEKVSKIGAGLNLGFIF